LIKYFGVGYALILLITVTFAAVVVSNSYFDAHVTADVVMSSNANSTNTELSFENPNSSSFPLIDRHANLRLDAGLCDWLNLFSNFSMQYFCVSITATDNETIQNPIVEVWIVDEAGFVVGYGNTVYDLSPFWHNHPGGNKVFSAAPVTVIFGYNVPSVLRGQVLQVHVWWNENGFRWLIGTKLFTAKTFPNLIEAPRILFFFFAFSTLPVGTFLPARWKKKIDACLNSIYLNRRHQFSMLMVLAFLLFALYWNFVCKFFII
jgi:hypothetical protein